MTLASVLTGQAAALLFDATNVHWSSAELLSYLNDAQRKIVELKPDSNGVYATVSLVAGVQQPLPSDLVELMDVVRNVNGQGIRKADFKFFTNARPSWTTDTASAVMQHYMVDERSKFYFWCWPPQSSSPGQAEILYAQSPADLPNTGTAITLQDQYRNAMLEYMLFRAYSKGGKAGNTQAAAMHYELFEKSLDSHQEGQQATQAQAARP